MPYPKKSPSSRAIARANSKRSKWKRVRFRDNRTVTEKDGIGMMGYCWCGEKDNHDWPGKADGEPHPYPKELADLPPKVQAREAQLAFQESGVCPVCRGYPENMPAVDDSLTRKAGHCAACLDTGVFPPPSYEESRRILKERESDG